MVNRMNCPVQQNDNTFLMELAADEKRFKLMAVGRSSYSGQISITNALDLDKKDKVYCIHVGRYTSIAENLSILVDVNHDYHSVYQGVIPEFAEEGSFDRSCFGQIVSRIHRKGQILIGNDCWIGNNVTILGG